VTYTTAQLTALKEAYASGVTEVTYDGKTIKYRSLAELAQAIATVQASVAPQTITRVYSPRYSKGL
jgi:hypothetical protein